MCRNLAAVDIAQRVGEPLGQHLHSGFRYVVSRVSWRERDPLLGTGIDDRARRVLIYHRLGESLYAIDDAPKIDVQHTLPVLVMVPRTAARRGAGIVHQYGN